MAELWSIMIKLVPQLFKICQLTPQLERIEIETKHIIANDRPYLDEKEKCPIGTCVLRQGTFTGLFGTEA